ncbi:nitrate ABC transporter substrate-binding protein, partial [Klebsiella pneumoniae]
MAVRGPVDKGVLQCVCTVGRFFFAHGGADMGDKFSISRRRLLQAGEIFGYGLSLRAITRKNV